MRPLSPVQDGNAADEETAKAKEDAEAAPTEPQSKLMKAYIVVRNATMRGLEQDVHKIVEEDPIVAAIHKNAEVFDPKTEYAFSYLQVRDDRVVQTCF